MSRFWDWVCDGPVRYFFIIVLPAVLLVCVPLNLWLHGVL